MSVRCLVVILAISAVASCVTETLVALGRTVGRNSAPVAVPEVANVNINDAAAAHREALAQFGSVVTSEWVTVATTERPATCPHCGAAYMAEIDVTRLVESNRREVEQAYQDGLRLGLRLATGKEVEK